jgi:hypothetical protein
VDLGALGRRALGRQRVDRRHSRGGGARAGLPPEDEVLRAAASQWRRWRLRGPARIELRGPRRRSLTIARLHAPARIPPARCGVPGGARPKTRSRTGGPISGVDPTIQLARTWPDRRHQTRSRRGGLGRVLSRHWPAADS